MSDSVSSAEGRVFPLWIKLPATFIGILFAGVGMSRVFRGGGFRDVLVPIAVGAIMIFVSGFEKHLSLDEDGAKREKSFWGQRRIECIEWGEISDVRVIQNKGAKLYVLPHSDKPTWPMSFRREQESDVLALLRGHLAEDRINIEG